MRIQHNILAMNAYRNYNTNTSALAKNLEKLSSGYKINRAGDDAAGLAISEKMRAQITGLNAAQKNVKDGISLVKTAEGAMQEIQDMLNRMDYLATQSANGTYDNEVDRKNLQAELDALRTEINRIADSSNFNGINLLDGSLGSTSTSAVGELDESAMVDGIKPSAAGNAKVVVNMGAAAAGGGETKTVAASTDAAKTHDGKDPSAATADVFTFKVADSTGGTQTKLGEGTGTNVQVSIDTNSGGGTQTKISDLATATDGNGTLLKDLYDIEVTPAGGGTAATSWSSTTTINAGDTIKLTAKTKGESSVNATDIITGADGDIDVTAGVDEGDGAAATKATYAFDLDLTALEGGQTISLGGASVSFDATVGGTSSGTTVNISGIDWTDLAANGSVDTLATAVKTAMGNAFADYNVEVTFDGANTTVGVKLTAKTAGTAANKGQLEVSTNSTTNPVSNAVHTKGTDAADGVTGEVAKVTYESEDLKASNLKAGAEITVGSTTIKVVANNATTLAANEIKEQDVSANLQKLLREKLPAGAGTVNYNATNGALEFTGTVTKDGTLDALKSATAVTVKTPPVAGGKAKNDATGWNGLEIEAGTTKVQDLKNKTITLDNGETVKLSDLFNITVKDGSTTVADSAAITGTSQITFEAKQKGKLSDTVMDAITYNTGASTEITPGWDEGENAAGKNTHYEISIKSSLLAGGQAFSFGTDSAKTKTFEFDFDDNETDNGTVTTPAAGTEVGDERVPIDLSNITDINDQAEAIKQAVAGEMTDFNVKVEVSGGEIKLTLDAKQATEATNLGGVRYSSASGAFTGAVYNAYNAFDGGSEGTYAQVSYDFDISQLKSGDSLTVGNYTINVGDKTVTEKDDNGNITSITLSEADAQDADKLVMAFESAGYQQGKIDIDTADKKMTITDANATGGKAEALAKGNGKVSLTSTRTLTSGGLTLQIGDTADSFNQMSVAIGDMHTKAMGTKNGATIADIDISNQSSAQSAIKTIKDAINYVSSVRGDLGATQNRLEHTANNLSVMAENIQDAESTIRDTDIAEEMMAYTKNNILVQSAQAMLAQANAVPQGVLQLLG